MHFHPRRLPTRAVLFLLPTLTLTAQEGPATDPPTTPSPQETRLWQPTGTFLSTEMPLRSGPRRAPGKAALVDTATLEQLHMLQKRASRDGQHPEGPSLMYDVAVNVENIGPDDPPSPNDFRTKEANDFVLFKNTTPSTVTTTDFLATIHEPTTVTAGNRVFYTANWFAAESTDGGDTWSFVNPFTGPFSPVNGGFCCDQTVDYTPRTNTMFFLQQYIQDGSNGTQRINVDQHSDGDWDCYLDLTPAGLGIGARTWADFPDMAHSNNFLYVSSNVFSTITYAYVGAYVARVNLTELAGCSGSVTVDAYTDGSLGSFRLSQGAGDTMYFASHLSLSSIRIWSWPEASSSPSSFDRSVTAWMNGKRICPGPDGKDWCGFIDHRILGAYVTDDTVGFMWTPSQGGDFPYPYTRIAQFSTADLSLQDEVDIWSADHAWVYGSIAPNARGDIGGTIMFGGGDTLYPSCAAWIVDEVNGHSFAPLENRTVISGSMGPHINRSGDYLTTRASNPDDLSWSGSCFAYTEDATYSQAAYVKFGREQNADLALGQVFRDGFESGDLSIWQ